VTPAERAFTGQLERLPGAGEPAFASALRASGRDLFLRAKLPTLKHEDWRYTSLARLATEPFEPAPPARAEHAGLPPAPRIVFVNGRIDRAATDLSGLAPGVKVGSLAAALRERPATVEPLLGRLVTGGEHAFGALNDALFEDGALVEVSGGVEATAPIHLVFVSSAGPAAAASHPRTLLVGGRGSSATIIESYRGRGRYLVNAVTEVSLEQGARLEHDRIQEDAPGSFHMGILRVRHAADSRFLGQSTALGAELARVEARALLAGEGAPCDLHGLYIGSGSQVLDHLVLVDHASPRCTSREVYKGILDGASRGVFAGRIRVREGAQKTDAGQITSNLLLSEDATVDAKPQLEILADDVKCSHGGSVGQIREDQLFYLRSRGVAAALARAMLTWAFASEMVERVGPAGVRDHLRRAVTARLPSGELLREVA
jgi:Fe-S cluster assembly protein SufD